MTTSIAAAKDLDLEALKLLSAQTGPCLTITLPERRPGAPEGVRSTVLRSFLRSAAATRQPAGFLEPLEELCEDPALEGGGPGLAIFRAPGFLACYQVPAEKERAVEASHFLLAPFVVEAHMPAELFALGLSVKRLRLFHCTRRQCQEVAWPEGVPASLEEAGQYDRGERSLENRSTAGVSTGDMRRVRFGTATDRDTSGAYLHDFFERVHRGLKPLLADRPLVVMGVRGETAAYQRVCGGSKVLAAEPGNIEYLPPAEIGWRAREALRRDYFERGARVLAEIREIPDRRRAAVAIAEVLRAAAQGRVHRLCVRAETELAGPWKSGTEDLVNAAVAETLRAGGEVFVVTQDRMPEQEPLAAQLRYSQGAGG
jgi:hypothetical protein